MKSIRVALVGQPNVGKSMLINSISNAKLRVGNFTGVTVEKKEITFSYEGYNFVITDLPGTYSLNDFSLDERVTKEFLDQGEYDLILNVLDSTNFERNFTLSTELFELHKKIVLALNMSDEAQKEGIAIDIAQLKVITGVDVFSVSALKKEGLDPLLKSIIKVYEQEEQFTKIVYSEPVEEEIERIVKVLKDRRYVCPSPRQTAIKLLKNDKEIFLKLHEEPLWLELEPILRDALEHLYLHHQDRDLQDIFAQEHMAFARGVATEIVTEKKSTKKSMTEIIDAVLIDRIFGLPIFFALMWGLFQLTFTAGAIPMDIIDAFFAALGDKVGAFIENDTARSLFVDGIIAGVGAVVLFLPNIVILFLGIALLESTGYMARVAFLLDGFFHRFGLHGKSFIPLITGFGCSVPAYMSARTIKSETGRLITLYVIGFMSCGARLPVYVLFAGAFFADSQAGNVLFIIYISGALIGMLAAKFLSIFIFKEDNEPFVMEMPKYRMPSLKLLWHTVYLKALMYLKKAGTFILGASVVIWFASSFPTYEPQEGMSESQVEKIQLEQSYLGRIGHAIEPIFEPLGFDWKMTVALQTGLAAKEVVVSTLGVLYSLGSEVDETNEGLIQRIKEQIPFASAVSFLVFIMLYLPCLAASMVFARESGSFKHLGYLFIFTTAVSYLFAYLAYLAVPFIF